MKKLLLVAPAFAFSAVAAAAGMYDEPYALVERGEPSPTRKEARLAISKIDGKSPRNPRRSDPVSPGRHVITLHFESARGIFRPETKDVEIDLEACARYRFVAEIESPTGPEWKPRAYKETIGECASKFGLRRQPR